MGLDNPLHIAFLVVILLLVFGARRLPEIGRSLGTGMREFKDSVTGGDSSAKGSQAALAPGPEQSQAVAQQQPPAEAAPVPTEATAPSGPSTPA